MGLFGTSKQTIVVSIDEILKSKGARGNVAPRQQLQVLRALSRVVQREKINVSAVIVGEPLNKAPHNKLFDGVRVRYAKTGSEIGAEMIKSLKQAAAAGVLVTQDLELEKKVLRSGGDTLRTSTFRKLLDDGGEAGGGQKNNGGNRERSNNSGRKNNKRRDRKPRPEGKNKRPAKPEKQNREQDEISQMIDLID